MLQIPYDSGRKNFRVGNGPARVAGQFIKCKAVSSETIAVEERSFELGTTVQILRTVSQKVRAAIADNHLPILFAGGCINTLGSLSAIGADTALVWFDAHADFNTPETTPSGFVDGMALATITGRCWRTLRDSIPGFHPIAEKNVVLIGARDLDLQERMSIIESEITWLSAESIRENGVENTLSKALSSLPRPVYFHIDLDVLDCEEACVNEYSSTGGLAVSELLQIIQFVSHNRAIVGASVTAYDPSVDHDSRALHAAVAVVKELLSVACIDVS